MAHAALQQTLLARERENGGAKDVSERRAFNEALHSRVEGGALVPQTVVSFIRALPRFVAARESAGRLRSAVEGGEEVGAALREFREAREAALASEDVRATLDAIDGVDMAEVAEYLRNFSDDRAPVRKLAMLGRALRTGSGVAVFINAVVLLLTMFAVYTAAVAVGGTMTISAWAAVITSVWGQFKKFVLEKNEQFVSVTKRNHEHECTAPCARYNTARGGAFLQEGDRVWIDVGKSTGAWSSVQSGALNVGRSFTVEVVEDGGATMRVEQDGERHAIRGANRLVYSMSRFRDLPGTRLQYVPVFGVSGQDYAGVGSARRAAAAALLRAVLEKSPDHLAFVARERGRRAVRGGAARGERAGADAGDGEDPTRPRVPRAGDRPDGGGLQRGHAG